MEQCNHSFVPILVVQVTKRTTINKCSKCGATTVVTTSSND